MNSLTINSLRKSKHSALTTTLLLATLLFATRIASAQQLQQGVSVQMVTTTAAAPMPDADNQDAWIVAVTADGTTYFGIDPVNPSNLADAMKSRLHHRDQKLYIKADARAPFAGVQRILEAGRAASFEAPVLLTSQPAPGSSVAPQGLEVLLAPSSSFEQPTIVQVTGSPQQALTLRVDGRQIPWANLRNLLVQVFQSRPEKAVLVKADGALTFADVAHVIDTCHSAGAKVILATPTL